MVVVNVITEPIVSGNRQLSDKIITLYNHTLDSSGYVVSNGGIICGIREKVSKQFEAAPEVPCEKHDKADRWFSSCVRHRGHSCPRVHVSISV